MKTDDLIKMLAADNASVAPPISRTLLLALMAGAVLAAAHFFSVLAVRADFVYAITHDPRFIFKFVFTLGIAIPATLVVLRLSRPDGTAGVWKWVLALPLVLLAAAVGLEMLSVPANQWHINAMGSMPGACMKYIPLLSIAPLLVMLVALRKGAPSNPTAAGAAAGLMSAGIGAALYASFCVDDSPMFLAIWYIIGMVFVVIIGAVIGNRLLRW